MGDLSVIIFMGYTDKQQIFGMSASKLSMLCIDPQVTQQQEILSNCLASSLALEGGVYSPKARWKRINKTLDMMPVSGYNIITGAKQYSRHG